MCIERLRLPSPFGKTKAAPLSNLLTKAAFLSLPASSGVLHCIPRNTFSLITIRASSKSEFFILPKRGMSIFLMQSFLPEVNPGWQVCFHAQKKGGAAFAAPPFFL
jgi:hypothetical protein